MRERERERERDRAREEQRERERGRASHVSALPPCHDAARGEFIDYKTSLITDEDPLRRLLFYWDLGFSHTLHILKEARGIWSCLPHF
jgi:hypothetical protein